MKTSIGYFSGYAVAHRSVIFMALESIQPFAFFAMILVVIIFGVLTVFIKHFS